MASPQSCARCSVPAVNGMIWALDSRLASNNGRSSVPQTRNRLLCLSLLTSKEQRQRTRKLANEVANEVYVTLDLTTTIATARIATASWHGPVALRFMDCVVFVMEFAVPISTLKGMLLFPSHLLQLLNRFCLFLS